MTQLNDAMAAQIMGELDTMTKNIDTLQMRVEQQLHSQVVINDEIYKTKKHFVLILDNLKVEVSAFKNGQTKSVQDQLAVALQSIDAKTKLQLEVLEIGANNYLSKASKKVSEILRPSVQDARDTAVAGTLEIIEKRFVEALASVAGANKSFEDAKRDFVKSVKACVENAKTAIDGYDTALRASVKNHSPIGLFGVFSLALLASVFATAMSATSFICYERMKTSVDAENQSALSVQAERGKKFDEVFQQLDKATKEKILKIWK